MSAADHLGRQFTSSATGRAVVYPSNGGFGIHVAGKRLQVPTISSVYDELTPRGYHMGRTPFVWSTQYPVGPASVNLLGDKGAGSQASVKKRDKRW